MRLGRKCQHLVKYTDATDIPVCLKKNADRHKTMARLASLGRSSKGWYFGLKMTITRDAEGRLLAVQFTSATKNDRKIFREINRDIYGIIVADAGYTSKELEKDMNMNMDMKMQDETGFSSILNNIISQQKNDYLYETYSLIFHDKQVKHGDILYLD